MTYDPEIGRDMRFQLQSPAGTVVGLVTSEFEESGVDQFKTVVFDDNAENIITSHESGTFRPEEPLSAFNSQDIQGNWKT